MKHHVILIATALLASSSALAMPFQAIEKSDFKGVWPFSFKEAQLQCLDGAAYVMNFDDNKMYALTGFAKVKGKKMGVLPLDPDSKVWLDNPDMPGMKMSLGDVTTAALVLCDK
ncbi:YebY family protein [Erwinia pyrifoliae]|uniref:YebY family protein n=1 Tax=Erwinia pyrifoliae TaxID=79967 RepID=UPI00220619F9|nr:YebY family protein [Erwinia pyrifoliae]MCT2388595.1 YebY family protein [Erwinia pyrifoliae]UWS30644.1 YebY family protein [Erwinia pyrifoliae]